MRLKEQLNNGENDLVPLKKRRALRHQSTGVDSVCINVTPNNNAGFLQEDASLESKPRNRNIEMQAVRLDAAATG